MLKNAHLRADKNARENYNAILYLFFCKWTLHAFLLGIVNRDSQVDKNNTTLLWLVLYKFSLQHFFVPYLD